MKYNVIWDCLYSKKNESLRCTEWESQLFESSEKYSLLIDMNEVLSVLEKEKLLDKDSISILDRSLFKIVQKIKMR